MDEAPAGELAFLDGDYRQAVEEYERARGLFRSALDADRGWGNHGFGRVYLSEADGWWRPGWSSVRRWNWAASVDRARTMYRETLGDLRNLEPADSSDELAWYTRSQLGWLALAQGDLRERCSTSRC